MQREGGEGGSVYLRLSTRTLDQPQRIMTPDLQADIADGAYWLRKPGPNCRSRDRLYRRGRARGDRGRRPDRRKPPRRRPACDHLGRPAAWGLDRGADSCAAIAAASQHLSHIEKLLAPLPRDCGIVTVIDGHPATLGWLGSVRGPSRRGARRRAFRPDRHHRRPLPPPRHRCQRHHRRGRKPHRRRAGAASENGGVDVPASGGRIRHSGPRISSAPPPRCAASGAREFPGARGIFRVPDAARHGVTRR